ncbi:glycosyltransferase family 39 protein [Arthrobacter sp. AK04]|uniref:ArnT family glycosyltransferase n=1 Tax=Arthrobacter sp. AK04 TaxID=2900048 RepID=UPI001E523986|nr:glycosyltransferase family 39 protein [Arthrobacter sp. AK04]MCD5341616.1 glycosyltransferase family 39 protein [Arthrobacter sp. AK04]
MNILMNFWNLGINDWGNYYYAAAVQAGTKNMTSAFFGSSDWGNSITVDKPPLSLWVMELSAQIFGFTPMSILAPQAIMGVVSTVLIYAIVRKHFSPFAALLAALVFCTTPIVVLMSRYNNPDPLMLLLMLTAIYLMQRAIAYCRPKYVILTAAILGLAFMTKQLQALMVLPSIAAAYICWFQRPARTKAKQLLTALGALVVTGGSWMVAVDLIPSSMRPYVGGSPKNSVLELTLAYNGIDRVITKDDDTAGNLVPQQFRQVESDAGLARLLNANYGQEIGWTLVCGIVCTIAILLAWRLLPVTQGARATAFMALSWFTITFLVLSFMGSQIHTYYTAALAPPLSLVIGVAADMYVRHLQSSVWVRLATAIAVLGGAGSSWLLLSSVVGWPDWLPITVLACGILGASMLAVVPPNRVLLSAGGLLAVGALLAGPSLTSLQNVSEPHNGSNPVSGMLTKSPGSISRFLDDMQHGKHSWAHDIAFGKSPGPNLVGKLTHSGGCTWAAATYASQTAARLQLESDRAVMPLGGFAGADPAPVLADFVDKVKAGNICYFLGDEDFLSAQPTATAVVEISRWVKANFESEEVDGQQLYDLRRRS